MDRPWKALGTAPEALASILISIANTIIRNKKIKRKKKNVPASSWQAPIERGVGWSLKSCLELCPQVSPQSDLCRWWVWKCKSFLIPVLEVGVCLQNELCGRYLGLYVTCSPKRFDKTLKIKGRDSDFDLQGPKPTLSTSDWAFVCCDISIPYIWVPLI